MSTESFTDLRTASHNASGISDESVWPSFTDIMTVIVMIFMMSLLVILLRNDELIVELKRTILSEQATAEFAQEQTSQIDELLLAGTLLEEQKSALEKQLNFSEQSNQSLSGELNQTVIELSALKSLRDRLSTDKTQLESDIAQLQQQYEATQKNLETIQTERAELRKQNADLDNLLRIAQQETVDLSSSEALLKTEREELLQKLSDIAGSKAQLETAISNVEKERDDLEKLKQSLEQTLSDEKTRLTLNIDELNKSYAASQNRQTELEKENQELLQQITTLNQQLALRPTTENITSLETDIESLEQQVRTQQEKYAAEIQGRTTLQGDFEELKRKYNLAVRPARSTEGKYVVDIRIRKVGGSVLYELREPGTVFVAISRSRLEERLLNLKAQDPYKLYTKVIFPEDSNLTYNEAFTLQTDIQSRFDYYDHGEF